MENAVKKDKTKIDDDIIELDCRDIKIIPVSIDGKQLPLQIGSKVNIGDGLVRTVMKVQVNEDGDAMYGMQWIDGIEFKLDWMTYTELCYMSSCLKNKPKISL